MNRFVMFTIATLLLIPLASGCDKDKSPTTNPDGTATGGPQPEFVPDVPQEPDPAEIAAGRSQYLLGNYEEAVGTLESVYEDLKSRKQYRASGLAGAWLALGHAASVVENAEVPSAHAVAMADKTGDPEVKSAANLAQGQYQLGIEEFDAAIASFETAAAAGSGTAEAALAHVFLAEARIGRAYGGGESTELKNPKDLDEARTSYEEAGKLAKATSESDILLGRVQEGLAAVAKYKGEAKAICEHAKVAGKHYHAAGASDFLKQGPQILARDASCPE